MLYSKDQLRSFINAIPTATWSCFFDGSADFFNQRWLDYTGFALEQTLELGWKGAIHPDDLPRILEIFEEAVHSEQAFEVEGRIRRSDGAFRWFLVRGNPLQDASGKIVRWCGTNTDIDDRKRAEEALRESEQSFRVILDGIAGLVAITTAEGEIEFANNQVFEYFGKTLEELKGWATNDAVHPDDLPNVVAAWRHSVETGDPYDVDHRLRRADGAYLWFHSRGVSLRDAKGCILRWYVLLTDIDERKRWEEKLRRSEAYLSEAQKLSHTGSAGWDIATREIYWSQETFRIYELDPTTKVTSDLIVQRTHPEDRSAVQEVFERVAREPAEFDLEHRILMGDGSVKYLRVMGHPSVNDSGRLEMVGAVTDITEHRHAEQALRRSEADLLEAQRLSHTGSFRHELSTGRVIVSPEVYRIYGIKADEDASSTEFFFTRFHPEDRRRVVELFERSENEKMSFQVDNRIVLSDGTIKHLHSIGHPVLNESGDLVEYVGTTMDVTEHVQARVKLEKAFEEIKHLKDQLHDENVVLREQIDQAFMFEEIVGSSQPLRTVLSRIVKVAPTDSTVLVTGETGTGKELIARAIHKRSQRSSHAFVSVNCASIPSSLIASELFGHEKGAFTGALQQRQGRFELAHSGTIFLDEVGELPAETQITLLRVLQEREFERVGGTRVIRTDVRVIAATNRNLSAAIAAGTFRADLFYRLNVFPIEMPPLRERKEDIPVLVEYFVKRFAEKMGKHIRRIDKKTLELCQRYHWPGNIRELQNIIERSVILSGNDTFSIDEPWLPTVVRPEPELSGPLTETLLTKEKKMIEAALVECKGKIAGPNGAAAKLGIPPSTLDSKIKQLRIKRAQFANGS